MNTNSRDDEDLDAFSSRDRVRILVSLVLALAVLLWIAFHFLQPAPPRQLVIASGAEYGMYHTYANRYREILARDGVTLVERLTGGAEDNMQLLRNPNSGVDVAFAQGGMATAADADSLDMIASLYYEPLWIFYRDPKTLTQLNHLVGKRVAVGAKGSGTLAFVTPILAANKVTAANTEFVQSGAADALAALRAGQLDAVLLVGSAKTALILDALHDPAFKMMSLARAEAFARLFPYVTRLTLPPGTIDLGHDVPDHEVTMIGTKALLVGREGLHPALVNLLLDAAREVHGGQGFFEAAGEFPGTVEVDLPVSPDADRHKRFGPSLLHRYLPFWLATVVERTIILVVPLLVVLIPIVNFLPQFLRWRVRSRIYRIERAVAQIKTPTSFASEAYTLREHIGIVRREVERRTRDARTEAGPASA
jgi:TRAP-type uncharacterized transport system substrate-binding protein